VGEANIQIVHYFDHVISRR